VSRQGRQARRVCPVRDGTRADRSDLRVIVGEARAGTRADRSDLRVIVGEARAGTRTGPTCA